MQPLTLTIEQFRRREAFLIVAEPWRIDALEGDGLLSAEQAGHLRDLAAYGFLTTDDIEQALVRRVVSVREVTDPFSTHVERDRAFRRPERRVRPVARSPRRGPSRAPRGRRTRVARRARSPGRKPPPEPDEHPRVAAPASRRAA